MPMMQDLIDQLNEAPPQSEGELRELLAETGYDLVMTEPSMEGDSEYDEDMGPEDEEGPDASEEPMELMEDMLAPPMMEGNDLSPKGRGKLRVQVAKFALKDDKNKRGKNYE